MRISDIPVTLGDIPRTIAEETGISVEYPVGPSLTTFPKTEHAIIFFILGTPILVQGLFARPLRI